MRLSEKLLLHAAFRTRLLMLEQRLATEKIPLRLYEGARTPWRQAELYARGRSIAGTKVVTRAKAWNSFHQYGLGADYVFYLPGRGWKWDVDETAEPALHQSMKEWWARYIVLARSVGIDHARDLGLAETPHVQFPWSLKDLQSGLYPPDGGPPWCEWLGTQAEQWGSVPRDASGILHPPAPPPFDIDERPEVA